jgi:hypothetical protein
MLQRCVPNVSFVFSDVCLPLPSCSLGVLVASAGGTWRVLARAVRHFAGASVSSMRRRPLRQCRAHNDELYSSKQQGDIALKAHVASICFKCLRCSRGILPVFQMDVVKVDWDVAYVAMVVHACCKGMFSMFYLCFQTYAASVLSGCCICFTQKLQVFHLDVAYVSHIYCKCFIWMLHIFCNGCTSVFWCFRCMLQVFQLF